MYEQVKEGAAVAPTIALAPVTASRNANAEPPAVNATAVPVGSVVIARHLKQ